MLAVYIDFGECSTQPISISLAPHVGWCRRLRFADPIEDLEPHGYDRIIRSVENAPEEADKTVLHTHATGENLRQLDLVPLMERLYREGNCAEVIRTQLGQYQYFSPLTA